MVNSSLPHPHSLPCALVICSGTQTPHSLEILENLASAINKKHLLLRAQPSLHIELIPNWDLCSKAARLNG